MGIILGFYFKIPLYSLFASQLLLLPILYLVGKRQSRKGFPFFECITLSLTIILGITIVGLSTSSSISKLQLDTPHLWELKIKEVLKPNAYTQRYVAQVLSADSIQQEGNLIISFPMDSLGGQLKVDDELLVTAKLDEISPPLNLHQFDYRDYLKKLGICYQIRASYETILMKNHPSTTLYGQASQFRQLIISKLKNEAFGKDELSVIQALLLGYRDDISDVTYDNYKNAGAVHILAVSGLHVGVLLLLLQFLLSPLERLPKGKNLKLVGIVFLLWTYAFIAGLSPSIVRAVTMFTFLAYAMNLNRPTNPFNILALSMFFILLVKPLFLFQVGFQMSYAAVFAIVWIYPKLQLFWLPEHKLVQKVWQLLSVSISAQLGVLPISLYYFHQFPALFFVSNLLVVPFLGLILGFGILIIVLSLTDVLPQFMVTGYNFLIETMNSIIAWVGDQEQFLVKDIPFDRIQLVLGYFLIISLVVFLSKPKMKTTLSLAIGIVLFQLWGLWNQIHSNGKETLILAHKSKQTFLLHQIGDKLNLHSGDSLMLPSLVKDYQIAERIKLIEYHPLKNSFWLGQEQLYLMDSFGSYPKTKKVDYLLLTHSPKIHLGRLLDSIKPKTVLADGTNYTSYLRHWKQTCMKKNIPFHSTHEKGYFVFDLTED